MCYEVDVKCVCGAEFTTNEDTTYTFESWKACGCDYYCFCTDYIELHKCPECEYEFTVDQEHKKIELS